MRMVPFTNTDKSVIWVNPDRVQVVYEYEHRENRFTPVETPVGAPTGINNVGLVTRICFSPNDFVEVLDPTNFVICKLLEGGKKKWTSKRKSKR